MQDETSTQGAPGRLRCEYLTDPIGIDVLRPRLSWWVGDERPAEVQTAYHILAASHPDLLASEEGDLWDTGRVEGRETTQIEYQGKPLVSGRRVWWKVRSFDSDGLPSPWSAVAQFEASLLDPAGWQGRWISAGLVGSKLTGVPVPLFGRTFTLAQSVTEARLYVAARGQVALQVNGEVLDPGALAPNWSSFDRRAEFLTYDVTGRLRAGHNGIGVLLADGWFAGNPGTGHRQHYGERPEFLLQLNVLLADGHWFQLATDSGWRWQPSWILSADPVAGEQWDETRRRRSWLGDGPDGFGWYPVELGVRPADDELALGAAAPVSRSGDGLLPGRPIRWDGDRSTALFEFDQSVLGRARLHLTTPPAGVVRIRYGLSLNEQGELIGQGEDACVTPVNGSGEPLEAQFSLHGFRYVTVSGDLPGEDAAAVTAVPVVQHQDPAASLVTDHPQLNRLFDLLVDHLRRTQGVVAMAGLAPTERIGEVATVGASMPARLLALDSLRLVTRWLDDMAGAQTADGRFPAVVPVLPDAGRLSADAPAGSSAAYVEALWQLYVHSGDRRLLRRHFGAVKRLLTAEVAAARELVREDPGGDPACPADLAATAWLFRSARLASRLAGVLGYLSDLEDCEELAGGVRNAFRRRFVTPDGRVVGDSAAGYALVLGLGLLDRAEQRRARQTLIARVEAGLAAGGEQRRRLLGMPRMLPALSEHGRPDLAYRLLLETPLASGWEQSGRELAGLIAGGVVEWLVGTLGGFSASRNLSERRVAFRHMIIQPRPPLGFGYGDVSGEPPVRTVEAELATENGRFRSAWRITDEAFELTVRVPGNCTADVVLPDGSGGHVDAGEHHFRMGFGEAGDGIPVLREVS
ncbi:MAG TPA: family 78 glycoside hydrolase catalytic domain [Pseudomonadales bacterium]